MVELEIHDLCKSMEASDMEFLDTYMGSIRAAEKKYWQLPHPARAWEYGMAVDIAKFVEIEVDGLDAKLDILDVGGCESLLPAIMNDEGYRVTVVDPRPNTKSVKGVAFFQDSLEEFKKKQFNFQWKLVLCVSVMEHVHDHEKFFTDLLDLVGEDGYLFITFDWDASGKALVPDHLRTYNQLDVEQMIKVAKNRGFTTFLGGMRGYNYNEKNVKFGGKEYNFASLCLHRIDA